MFASSSLGPDCRSEGATFISLQRSDGGPDVPPTILWCSWTLACHEGSDWPYNIPKTGQAQISTKERLHQHAPADYVWGDKQEYLICNHGNTVLRREILGKGSLWGKRLGPAFSLVVENRTDSVISKLSSNSTEWVSLPCFSSLCFFHMHFQIEEDVLKIMKIFKSLLGNI